VKKYGCKYSEEQDGSVGPRHSSDLGARGHRVHGVGSDRALGGWCRHRGASESHRNRRCLQEVIGTGGLTPALCSSVLGDSPRFLEDKLYSIYVWS